MKCHSNNKEHFDILKKKNPCQAAKKLSSKHHYHPIWDGAEEEQTPPHLRPAEEEQTPPHPRRSRGGTNSTAAPAEALVCSKEPTGSLAPVSPEWLGRWTHAVCPVLLVSFTHLKGCTWVPCQATQLPSEAQVTILIDIIQPLLF